jgi:predicted Ser/Thr protein kinase
MSVDPSNSVESEYRILLGYQVKYVTVDPKTFDSDTLSFPPDLLDQLPLPSGEWTRARVYRCNEKVSVELSYATLAGVRLIWHSNVVDVLSLTLEYRLYARVAVVKYGSKSVVAKIARFDFEIPLVERETAIYQAIEGHGIGPAFLGHLSEHGRIMGFLIEKAEGRRGEGGDLKACQEVVKRLHSLGIVHGDLNRHNFIVSTSGITLVDFENATPGGSEEEKEKEYMNLVKELTEEMGRGGGYIPEVDCGGEE